MKTERDAGNINQEYEKIVRYEEYRDNNKENMDCNVQLCNKSKRGGIEA
jgi:hypothetical protein